MSGRSYTMKQALRAAELRRKGYSQQEIARELGRETRTGALRRLLVRFGAPPCQCPDRLPQLAGRLGRLVQSGLHGREIERTLRLPPGGAVWRYLGRLGLEPTRDGKHHNHVREDVQEAGTSAAYQRRREECARLGWPEVTRPVEARILCALGRDALTRSELRGRLGWSSDRSGELGRHLRRMSSGGGANWRRAQAPLEALAGGRYGVGAWLLARRGLG